MNNILKIFIEKLAMILVLYLIFACAGYTDMPERLSNSSHLDHLCEDIIIEGTEMTIVHIYAEYPEYEWVADDDEGTACIDDAARAVVYYIRDYKYNNTETSMVKARKLLEFVLFMQDETGLYYNFIFDDGSINREHQNSINRPGWWTWRALWALTEAYPVLRETYPEYAGKYLTAIKNTVKIIKEYSTESRETEVIEGFDIPAWLPYKYASDQASVLIMCLVNYYNITRDESVLDIINGYAEGIMLMQVDNKESEFHGANLSWMNIWHAWGNLQSTALLAAYRLTDNPEYLKSALNEIDFYYRYLYEIKYLNEFSLRKENDKLTEVDRRKYSQIAYGLRPMVFAALDAHNLTGDIKYAHAAANYAAWLFGDNSLNSQIYFPDTGICFDGLNDNSLNKNSGAESTIEALLLLQEIEQNELAYSKLVDYINE